VIKKQSNATKEGKTYLKTKLVNVMEIEGCLTMQIFLNSYGIELAFVPRDFTYIVTTMNIKG
jgi:hypothetical protein